MYVLSLRVMLPLLLVAALAVGYAIGNTSPALAGTRETNDRAGRGVASIAGEVFFDSNLNGIREPAERGVADAHITLADQDGAIVGEAVTDLDGYYVISGLDYSTFIATVTPPNGYIIAANGRFEVVTAKAQGLGLFSTPVTPGLYVPFIINN